MWRELPEGRGRGGRRARGLRWEGRGTRVDLLESGKQASKEWLRRTHNDTQELGAQYF